MRKSCKYLGNKGIIDGSIPYTFLVRGIATDALRLAHKALGTEQGKKGALFVRDQSSKARKVENRSDRITYALDKFAVGISAPFFPRLTSRFAERAQQQCIERGIPVIFNPENIDLAGMIFERAKSAVERIRRR